MLIDSHCHLDYYDDLDDVLERAHAAGVGTLLSIGIGDGPETMHRALGFAHAHAAPAPGKPVIWASAGIHPQEASNADASALARVAELARDPRCIAVGEIGLDYYHADNPDVDVQQAAFIAQMKIAAAAEKPIIIHVRTSELATPQAKARYEAHGNPDAAWDDLLRLLDEHWVPTGLPGIMHCFSGNAAQAERALAIGFYLSFAGNVTYARSTVIQEVARSAPADRILVETDAPFLAPLPHRGERNEPGRVALTAQFVAELRGISPAELAAQTTANFHQLFPVTATA